MKKLKKILYVIVLVTVQSKAQDPSFSQFFSSPLNINPALTGNINSKWRVISNYRSQWSGPVSPYNTGTVSFDTKIFQNLMENYVDENTRIAIGGMMMYDDAMAGALKSNYASFNVTGNVRLRERAVWDYPVGAKVRHSSKIKMDEGVEQRLGVGLGVIYGNKRFDINKLSFEEQFTGNGFDINLPSGEAALAQMKGYLSVSAGGIYSLSSGVSNLEIGVAAFHFNKPKQTFLQDDKQYLPTRYVVHSNFESYLSEQVVLNTNGIYQYQSGASYFSLGGTLGYMFTQNETDMVINAGLWYWSKNAVIPYFGFVYGKFQVGLTYDFTISKLSDATRRPNTFELCMIVRGGTGKGFDFLPTPWK